MSGQIYEKSVLDKPFFNLMAIVVLSVIFMVIYIKGGGVPDNVGMAALFLNWIPILIGIVTIIFYLISRLMTKNRNWIVTVLGMGLNLIFVLMAIL